MAMPLVHVSMSIPAELRLCRRFPAQLHPLQVLIPSAASLALSSGPRPSPGSACVLSLRTDPAWAPGPGLFISATVTEEDPPAEAEPGPGEQGDRGPGPREQGDRGPGPREQGDRGPGPRDRGTGEQGDREPGPRDRGPGEQGDRGTGEQGDRGPGPRDRGTGEQGDRGPGQGDRGAGGQGARAQGQGDRGAGGQGARAQGQGDRGAGGQGARAQGQGGDRGPGEQGDRGPGPRDRGTGEQGDRGPGPGEPGAGVPLRIYTSRLFPKHYGLWVEDEVEEESPGLGGALSCLRVSLVQSVPTLTKVVLGARSKASLCWAGSQSFANGLLVLTCQRQQILLRQGDAPNVPYHPLFGEDSGEVFGHLLELVVLECQPVLQGLLSVNTSLVLTDFRDPNQLHANELQSARLLQPLYVSDFAHYTRALWGTGLVLEPGKTLDSDMVTFLQALECRLEVMVADLPGLADSGKLQPSAMAGEHRGLDADNLLVLTKPALQRLGLFNGEWVLISILETAVEKERGLATETEAERSSRSVEPGSCSSPRALGSSSDRWLNGRLASVHVVEVANSARLELADNMAAISHTLWFNISKGSPVPISNRTLKVKRFYRPSCVEKQLKDSRSALSVPPLAKELHVKVIFSPTYNARDVYDGVLFEHFKTQRLVHLEDVLCVRTRGKAEFIANCSERCVRWPVLYLKVRSVSGDGDSDMVSGFLADTEHTSLYLDGCGNSYIPCAVASNGHQFWGSSFPPGLSNTVDTLCSIMQPYLHNGPPILDGPCSILLWGPSGSGKTTVLQATSSRLNLHLVQVDCVCLCADSTGASEAKLQAAFSEADLHRPCILLLRHLVMIGRERDGVGEDSRLISSLHHFMKDLALTHHDYPVVVVGTVGRLQDLFADVQTLFLHELAMETLSEEQRKLIIGTLSTDLPLGKDVNLGKLAKLTAGYLLSDLCALLSRASQTACKRLRKSCFPGTIPSVQEELDLCAAGVTILWEDFQMALDQLQTAHSQAVGAPKIPTVRWQDVGGLQDIKREILDTVQLPLDHPELLTLGLRRTGLLLYGPPGTGKTLLAKAIATECTMTFLSVKGPELINMYVGQSEENVREVFSKARAAAPCVVFFDELDSLAPNRGRSGDSGGVMDRVVSQLLTELDGLNPSAGVFVIGATNRPDLLDQALLRPGRFDKLLYVGVSEDRETQLRILRAITHKFTLHPSVSLKHVVEQCPPYLSGADLYSLCSDTMMSALKRKISRIEEGVETEDSELVLMQEDFQHALTTLQPSVSQQDLINYRLIQQRLSAT
ncbi:peroxisome assembly factor 2 [Carcharodon carcharias]|uniref:peroxisome assembly factor 2 n=1 Tax=Carcharodon carcharias TaxID=13397 RepID=UPI001B7E5039|nr:peroxisome assembly factor 2 [Carcharodon carcharias]